MQKFPHFAVVAGLAGLASSVQASDAQTAAAWARHQSKAVAAEAALANGTVELTSTTDAQALAFADFLVPAADVGLEFSPRLKALAGQRVVLSGYIVRQPQMPPGGFILAPEAVTIDTGSSCAHGEIPPHAVHVRHAFSDTAVAYRPGLVRVAGILELGPERGADNRLTFLRLRLEKPAAGPVARSNGGSTITPEAVP